MSFTAIPGITSAYKKQAKVQAAKKAATLIDYKAKAETKRLSAIAAAALAEHYKIVKY